MLKKKLALLALTMVVCQLLQAQYLMDMVDTTKTMGKGLLQLYNKYNRIKISGYTQFQFQTTQTKGVKSFAGGDFAANVNNRFMIRRGRIRIDYIKTDKDNHQQLQLAMQLDGTEKGFGIRDFWGRLYENKWQLFSFTTGMFARPFGYEVNLGSSDRESPERGRMSQILLKGERDLGAMVSFEPRAKNHPLKYFKWDVGVFNGQGIPGSLSEYDSYKDFISRITVKPVHLAKKVLISGGVSGFSGGFIENTKYLYSSGVNTLNNDKIFTVDSAASNLGGKAPRKYYGADVQLKLLHKWGATEFRAEYWSGLQTSTAATSEAPAVPATEPYYKRNFNGAYFYILQNIVNTKNQLVLKFDWYDPNTKVSGNDIGKPGTNINATNIKYQTIGFGYNCYFNDNLRLLLYYDKVMNEKTQLAGFTDDVKDDVFTCRLQFRF
jgi:hypothetical protein